MPLPLGTFPAPRLQRVGPILAPTAGAAGALAAPPQTRIIAYSLSTGGANVRSSASSPVLRGPAIITGWHFAKTGVAEFVHGIGLGVAATQITETSVAVAVARPFRAIMEKAPAAVAGEPNNETTRFLDNQTGVDLEDDNLNLIVLDPTFHLVVFITSGAAFGAGFHGYVNVLETVSPQVLANFP